MLHFGPFVKLHFDPLGPRVQADTWAWIYVPYRLNPPMVCFLPWLSAFVALVDFQFHDLALPSAVSPVPWPAAFAL